MLPSTPRDTSPAPAEHSAQAILQEREAALKKALEKLKYEKARLVQEKALRELERTTNDLNRSNNDLERQINAATRAELAREKVRVEAKRLCNIPSHGSNGGVLKLRGFVVIGVCHPVRLRGVDGNEDTGGDVRLGNAFGARDV